MRPSGATWRYFTASNPSAYFVAIPKNAATSIQKSAPGPPVVIAVATPTMFPVPIVAESAVHSAPNADTSPWCPCPVWNMYRKALTMFRMCRNLSITDSNMPVARIATMSGTPHMRLAALSATFASDSSVQGIWLVPVQIFHPPTPNMRQTSETSMASTRSGARNFIIAM